MSYVRLSCEKRSFWHAWELNAWCYYDRSFLYLLDSNQSSHDSWGIDWRLKTDELQTKDWSSHENKTSWVQHRSKPLMTTTTKTNVVTKCTPLAIVLLIALYCIASDEIKCAAFELSCECNKLWTAIWLLYFDGLFLYTYFSDGMLLRDHGDVASSYLMLLPDIC